MPPLRTIIFGAGNIGTALAAALVTLPDVTVTLADNTDEALDLARSLGLDVVYRSGYLPNDLRAMAAEQDLIVAAVPDRAVPRLARLAAETGTHYLDFSRPTVEIRAALAALSQSRAVLTGCGASPGLIENIAIDLIAQFENVEELTIRVGAIPCHAVNRLGYGRIWNMDGLFDEYLLPSAALRDGRQVMVEPLEGYERLAIDGAPYEAFVTAGGMTDDFADCGIAVRNLTFKTIRHPGHLDYMRFLLDDLGLRKRRDMLKSLLCNGLPTVEEDMVMFFVTARGQSGGESVERSAFRRLAPAFQAGRFNALTRVAAGHAATLIGLLRDGTLAESGHITHRKLSTVGILESPFLRQ